MGTIERATCECDFEFVTTVDVPNVDFQNFNTQQCEPFSHGSNHAVETRVRKRDNPLVPDAQNWGISAFEKRFHDCNVVDRTSISGVHF